MDADTVLEQDVEIHGDAFHVYFRRGEDGLLREVTVSATVVEYEEFLPSFDLAPDGLVAAQVGFPVPPAADDLVDLLQYLESVGSFWLHIRRIHWERASYRWIPETEEEQQAIRIPMVSSARTYPDRRYPFRGDIATHLLMHLKRDRWLTIPMAFYREGKNEFRKFRYITAFYNFYFFLEDLYGKGKTKNPAVLDAFVESDQLRTATNATVSKTRERFPHHLETLLSLREGTEDSAEGVLGLVVWMRGNLHHYSSKSTTPKGHPLNQADYESLAFILMTICTELVRVFAGGTKPDA